MIRVCYSTFHIGDRILGEKEPLEDKSPTHGLCDECFPKEMEFAKREIERIRRKRSHQSGGLTRP